jgi:hypothetical protein
MRFMMIIYPDKSTESGQLPEPKDFEKMSKFNEELAKADVLITLLGLHPTSKGARIKFGNGKPVVTDGPFTESKELIGGYWIIDVKSKAEAIEWAKKVPAEEGEMIEIRQVHEFSEFPEDVQKALDSTIVREKIEKHK